MKKKALFVLLLKIGTYVLCLLASFLLAYNLKYSFVLPSYIQPIMWWGAAYVIAIKIAVLLVLGEFKGIFAYFRFPDLFKIVCCFSVVSCLLLGLRYHRVTTWIPHREIILSDLLFSILFILFFRGGMRIVNSFFETNQSTEMANTVKVAVIGTDEFASRLIAELKEKRFYKMKPVAVLDDNPKYFGNTLHSVPVLGSPDLLSDLAANHAIDGVVFAANLPQKRFVTLADQAKSLNLKVFNVPSLRKFLSGNAFASVLRPLDVEDFLAREPIHLDTDSNAAQIADKVVCITGAGGSIGSELALQVAEKKPKQLVLIDHSEFNLFKIQQTLLYHGFNCEPVLLNLTQADRLQTCLEKFRPEIIFHAAAYKHVPLLEDQPLVALHNNVLATGLLAFYAAQLGVQKFVLISTDKAIHPINYMGATKRICELLCLQLQKCHPKTQFMAVRFGNVLGSSGSVLQTFREQLAHGGPLTVTHPEMTRFFMTIPEAVSLILEAAGFRDGAGRIYVLDMGKPVKILDVAKRMIELNHFRVGTDIQIVFTGIRPGEKLHEDLVFDAQHTMPTDNRRIGWFQESDTAAPELPITDVLQQVQALASEADALRFIRTFIPDFKRH